MIRGCSVGTLSAVLFPEFHSNGRRGYKSGYLILLSAFVLVVEADILGVAHVCFLFRLFLSPLVLGVFFSLSRVDKCLGSGLTFYR